MDLIGSVRDVAGCSCMLRVFLPVQRELVGLTSKLHLKWRW